jgi:hypothetical protein
MCRHVHSKQYKAACDQHLAVGGVPTYAPHFGTQTIFTVIVVILRSDRSVLGRVLIGSIVIAALFVLVPATDAFAAGSGYAPVFLIPGGDLAVSQRSS